MHDFLLFLQFSKRSRLLTVYHVKRVRRAVFIIITVLCKRDNCTYLCRTVFSALIVRVIFVWENFRNCQQLPGDCLSYWCRCLFVLRHVLESRWHKSNYRLRVLQSLRQQKSVIANWNNRQSRKYLGVDNARNRCCNSACKGYNHQQAIGFSGKLCFICKKI